MPTPPPYQYVCDLAEGGMGTVELVFRREGRFERLYARKRLHTHHRRDDAFRAMFLDEARLAGAVRHANVVAVLDVGEDEDGPFLIMELVEGLPVAKLAAAAARDGRAVPVQIAVRIALDAARGLHAAHEARGPDGQPLGLVHRDVSPQNVLVGFDGTVRVTDFGIAKAYDNTARTATGVLKGNLGYLSPEQLRFEDADRRSDLFSLGVILYELLAGRRLYADADGAAQPRRILNEPPPDIGQARRDVPAELTELLFELLAKDRALRPATALELATRLEVILAGLVADEGPLPLAEHMRAQLGGEAQARAEQLSAALTQARARADVTAPPPPALEAAPGAAARTTTARPSGRRPLWRRAAVSVAALAAVAVAALVVRQRLAPTPGPEAFGAAALGAGGWHTCAEHDQRLYCWGKNNDGQLGIGHTTDHNAPLLVSLPARPIALALGWFHTCACVADGRLHCWGRNEEGQLGAAVPSPRTRPVPVELPAPCAEIAAGDKHTCARLTDGRVLCWGKNARGQAGQAQDAPVTRPTAVAGLTDVVQLDADHDATCIVRRHGHVACFGDNADGLLGEGAPAFRAAPAPIPGLAPAAEVAVGRELACARLREGQVACWGWRGDPKAGVRVERLGAPEVVRGVTDAVDITVGAGHGCARLRGDRLVCFWGNYFGQVGDGTRGGFRLIAAEPLGVDGVTAVAAGEVHTCARHRGGVSCWGQNETGQVGDGTNEPRTRPASVIGLARRTR